MIEAGLQVGLNTDDPSVFVTNMTAELDLVMQQIGLTQAQVDACNAASIDAAFTTDENKAELRGKFGLA